MEINHLLGYGGGMKYFCTRCQADVHFCQHKTEFELQQMTIKAEQFQKFAKYWEEEFFKLRDRVQNCLIKKDDDQ